MSYQVIARKWRPQTFDEVAGQTHVTAALRNAIRTNRVPHAILLSGPRGCGKTTLARILARCLNCEKGPTETPCGTCPSCEDIAAGTSTDVQEIDAASNTGVDNVRDVVIDAIRYAPAPGKHRIFVIDEVHMLSKNAFNALLKTLEEPPPSSLFIFATTDPDKIPITVQSRCQRYDLRLFSTADVATRLTEIAQAEGIEISETSLLALAREGQGSMRDSQTLLDQVIASTGNVIDDESVRTLLALTDRRVLQEILEAAIASDAAAALRACHTALQSGSEVKQLWSALIHLLRDLVILRVAPGEPGLVEGGEAEIAALRELAERAEPARLRRMFNALAGEQPALEQSPEPAAVLEMAIVRIATMPSGEQVAELLSRLERLEKSLAGGGGDSGSTGNGGGGAARKSAGGAPPSKQARAPEPSGAAPRAAIPEPAPALKPKPDTTPNITPKSTPRSQREPRPEAAASAPAGGNAAVPVPPEPSQEGAPLPVVLDRLRGFANGRDRTLGASLDDVTLRASRPGSIELAARSPFHHRRLSDRLPEVERLCSDFFGQATRVELVAPAGAEQTPTGDGPNPQRERERQQKREALEHPSVNMALDLLDAEIVDIVPLGGK